MNKNEIKYLREMDELITLRKGIENLFGRKWNRVYTECRANGKCRMKLYSMKKKHMKNIFNFINNLNKSDNFIFEKHTYKRWYGKVRSIVLRIK